MQDKAAKVTVTIVDSPRVVALLKQSATALKAMQDTGGKMAAALTAVQEFIKELETGGFLRDGTLMPKPAREYVAGRLYHILHPTMVDSAGESHS